MQSQAASVAEYLAGLPADRREIVEALRRTLLDNLDHDFEEGMQYGMIGYYVPHRVFPAGYHCDPTQPLPFAGIASQKQAVSLYLNCLYVHADDGNAELQRFREAWLASGKRLDMGASCVRIRKLADVPLAVVAETISRTTAHEYVARYQAARAAAKPPAKRPAAKKSAPKAAAAKKATSRTR